MKNGTTLIKYNEYDEPSYRKFVGENSSVSKYMINYILNELLFDFIPSNKTTHFYL